MRAAATAAPHRSRPRLPALAAAALLALAAALTPAVARADGPGGDPGLDQTIDAGEPITHGNHVIGTGHVDMGPKFDGGAWKFLIHDDAHKADADAASVWRYPDETVLRVVDAAKLKVPDSSAYSFVGAAPGSTVWVVPETQNPGVVWAGWNTQDPAVMSRLDRGATFSVTGVQGPGVLTVYLQSGDFGAPQVLWDSRKKGAQPIWVDTNTHTHANWVFTEPGVYLVRMAASATLKDGTKVSDTELVRFAVGTGTSTGAALAATWKGPAPTAPAATSPAPAGTPVTAPATAPRPAATTGTGRDDTLVRLLVGAIVVVALALVAGFTLVAVRGNRAKRRALAARTAAGADGGAEQ
ncbi:choice-of-anchor M domain-containing protein [Actinacidiphila epipremni]|uniref:tRNA-dihydrouridine synthase n=1 Tax=Actinacidiphila epipremni TaxID=2053013 RepID=A0ABX1A0Z6_9ACTN|nr:choice-of-anchor M domain-containing protein [Actinacidiphila epipremni]NJP48249.1 tRNA-dihydrouridine synthase [Actinacidiphila epipremni]